MANTVNNVNVGKPKVGGAVWTAPKGTTVPTDATSDLGSAYECLGFISDAGVTNSNSPSSTSFKAWGGDRVYDAQTEKPDTFKMVLIETTNIAVLKSVYGDDNVTGTLETGIHIKANSKEAVTRVLVIDMVLRDGALKRIVIPQAKVTAVADITYSDSALVGYDTTFSAYPSDAEGNTHHEYIKATGATGATGETAEG
jgi:hypothetical protein